MRKLADWLMEQPLLYRIWQAPFAEEKFSPVRQCTSSKFRFGGFWTSAVGQGRMRPDFETPR